MVTYPLHATSPLALYAQLRQRSGNCGKRDRYISGCGGGLKLTVTRGIALEPNDSKGCPRCTNIQQRPWIGVGDPDIPPAESASVLSAVVDPPVGQVKKVIYAPVCVLSHASADQR